MRTLVSPIPGIGSSIDIILSSEAQKIQYNRIKKTISCLTEEMSKIDKNKIDKSFLDSEEFFDLLLPFLEKSLRSRHIEKIRLNYKILAGLVLQNTVLARRNIVLT